MALRLALLATAAVIFAPYSAGDGHLELTRGDDPPAPVLASSFSEGAVRGTAPELNHRITSRDGARLTPVPVTGGPVGAALIAFALALMWLLTSSRAHVSSSHRFAPRPIRGPPLLQPA